MGGRDTAINQFLATQCWDAKCRAPLAGDASFRKYERLQDGDRRAVLMDAPPDKEDVRPFWALAEHLRALGYSAPEVISGDCGAGFLLLEDLGDDLFSRVIIDNPGAEVPLYEAAVDLLVDLNRHPVPEDVSYGRNHAYRVPSYDLDLLMQEVNLFTDWYLPELLGSSVPEADKATFKQLWREQLACLPAQVPVLVLRDYHADNLIWLPERSGVGRVGLLDFQDGVAGHPAYDLVSLLEDARRDVPPSLVDTMIDRYLAGVRNGGAVINTNEFRTAFAILGAQRNTKIIGIFTRLWRRDRKPVYLNLIPRVWGLLARALANPALGDMRRWYDAQVSNAERSTPLGEP